MAYTTSDLISSIERKSFSPEGQTTFSTTDILALVDDTIESILLPELMKIREDLFVYTKSTSIVANTASYDIPDRAVGGIIRDIKTVLDNTNVTYSLTRIRPEQVTTLGTESNAPYLYYLQNNKIVLHPTPTVSSHSIKQYYYLQPGKLVATSSCAVISAINTSTNVVTVSSIPSTWATGDIFDFIKKSGNHPYIDVDYTSTLISSNDITFSSLPSDLAVGDYVSVQGESCLVQLPKELRNVLSTLVAAEILTNTGQPGAKELMEKGMTMFQQVLGMLTPRIHSEDQIIVPEWE